METIEVSQWSDFGPAVERVRAHFSRLAATSPAGLRIHRKPRVLFRGQADASWILQTTLERKERRSRSVLSYLELACRHVEEIESLIATRWHLSGSAELRKEVAERSTQSYLYLPAYEYLVFLRHHGFPSPLLDWTESPFVAAYFACTGSTESDSAVFCYVETPDGVKSRYGAQPMIHVMGPHVRTHPRHFTQKAWYTVATRWDEHNSHHDFCSHEDVLALGNESQDVVTKLVLAACVRREALRALNDYNINEFTLFQTPDALVKAIEARVFDFAE